MSSYIFLLFVFFIPMIMEAMKVSAKINYFIYYFLIFLVLIFVAMRLETGYDWLSYRNYFHSISSISFEEILSNKFEPFYYLFNSILKELGFEFQSVIIVSGAFSVFAWAVFIKKFSPMPIHTLYFLVCFLLFSLLFSTIRQSIALAIFLFFLVCEKRFGFSKVRFSIFLFLSFLFQYSSFVYYLIYCISNRLPRKKLLLFAFLFLYFAQFVTQPIDYLLQFVTSFGFFSEKLTWYFFDRGLEVSIFDKIRIWVSAPVFFCVLTYYYYNDNIGEINKKICGFGVILIFVELFFIDYSVFRYRIYYFAFIVQAIYCLTLVKGADFLTRFFATVSFFAVGLLYVILFLNKPTASVLKPYQFWPYHYLTEMKSTGEERYNYD
ncbi:EpsG family protein [Vibrio sp. 1S139]|uniref:EpsG family protein n=1 Tax=Vibrio sp. 1S139 TaxID=3230006 RepID=UPI00352E1188